MSNAFRDMSPQEEAALKEEARQMCREDLHYLAKHVLGYNRLTDNYHRKMAEDIGDPDYKYRLLLHPRGHFKSTLGTEAFAVQTLLKNPSSRILITNAKLDNARKFMRTIARHFTGNPKFRWVWRDWWMEQFGNAYYRAEMRDKLDWVYRDTQDEFTLLRPYEGREASITTGAVGSSMVSQHYSLIIADDLINREYVSTQEMVEKSILYFKDLLDLLDPNGEMMIIGTRWSHADLYRWIIEEFGSLAKLYVPDGYLPEHVMEASSQEGGRSKKWMISIQPTSPENPIFPEEFDADVLDSLLKAKGPYEFGAQYLLNPTPKEHQSFQEEWFNHLDVLPDTRSMTACITVDPAKSLSNTADRTAIVVCCYDEHNRMYVVDGLNERLTPDEVLEAIFEKARTWSKKSRFLLPVGIEAVLFQELFIYNLERMMLERNFFFSIEPIRRRQQSKQERILRLVPRIKNGFYAPRKLMIEPQTNRDVPYDLVQRLTWELIQFPFAGYDDLADALADQLDIVRAQSLPKEDVERPELPERDFVHPSIIDDDRKRHILRERRRMNNIGVVR